MYYIGRGLILEFQPWTRLISLSSVPMMMYKTDYLHLGTAFPFALTLVEILLGKGKREEVKAPMVFAEGTPF
jgi:hypothetical protein